MGTLFLIHGNNSENDPYLDNYTDRDFRRLFRVQRRVYRRKLKSNFATAAEPFPARRKKGRNNISLGTFERIKKLDGQAGEQPGWPSAGFAGRRSKRPGRPSADPAPGGRRAAIITADPQRRRSAVGLSPRRW
jgi:hypothetical protein